MLIIRRAPCVGDLSALGKLTGHVTVIVTGDEAPTTISLTAAAKVGRARATGALHGSFTASSFTLTGDVEITVLGLHVNGTLKADNKGMAACGGYASGGHTYEAGFEYDWDGSLSFFGKKGCSEAGF